MIEWIVFKLLQNEGVIIGLRRWDIYRNPDEIIIYGPCSESEANDFYNDVRNMVMKPMKPRYDLDDNHV